MLIKRLAKSRLSSISLVIIILGFSFLYLLYKQRQDVFNQKANEVFESQANEISSIITSNMKLREESLKSIARFFASSLNVNKLEFNNFSAPILEKLNLNAICYFGEDGRRYAVERRAGKSCSSYSANMGMFDATTSEIMLTESMKSVDGTKGYAVSIFSFSSLIPDEFDRDIGPNFRVNLDAGNNIPNKEYNFFRDEEVFVSDEEADYYLTISSPRDTSSLLLTSDYLFVLILYLSLLVLTIYTVETGIKREKLISLKVRRQERAIKGQYDELVQQRKILNLNERLASIGVLAAGIGHEINNPLTVILGQVKSLKRKMSNGGITDIESKVDKVEKAAFRIEKIVSGLRKFSHQSRDEQNDSFSAKDVFTDTVSMLKDLYEKDGVSIKLTLHIDDNVFIKGDKGKFQQVLINLISNARDAIDGMKNGKISISVHQHQDNIDIRVRDNGIGMSTEQREKIFDLFYTTKDVGKGTGIGLSLVHGFIKDDFEGSISVNSELGKGAEFKLLIPFKRGSLLKEVKVEKEVTVANLNCRALVVDDEEGIRDLIQEVLEDHGVKVTIAENGQEAYDIFKDRPGEFDVIISDLKMPVMDGVTLLKKIRVNKGIVQPKFIIITGGVALELSGKKNKICKLVDGFIYKPFSEEDIIEEISNVLYVDDSQELKSA